MTYFRVFGSLCYTHVPSKVRHKMDARSIQCVFLGYPDERKGYNCYDPSTRRVYISRDVVFDEKDSWYKLEKEVMVLDTHEPYVQREQVEHRWVSETISGSSDAQASTLSSPWSGRLQNNGKQKVDDYDVSGIVSDTSTDSEIELPRV